MGKGCVRGGTVREMARTPTNLAKVPQTKKIDQISEGV